MNALRHCALALLPAAGCAWEVPLDTEPDAIGNVIRGELVTTSARAPADTMVLLFAADDPPPPDGLGSPVNFATVPASAFTDVDEGTRSAPFTLTGVPDGEWTISALMDVDGDFHPLLTSNAGATCGDRAGAYLSDLSEGEIGSIAVSGGEIVEGVPVMVGTEVPYERPAFRFAANEVDQTAATTRFSIESTGVYSELVELTGPFDAGDPDTCDTMFLAWAVDDDGDGAPDPHPSYPTTEGAYHIWPRVLYQYLPADEGELEEGEAYVGEAILDPTPVATGDWPVGTPVPTTELDAIFVPAVQHILPDGSAEIVQAPDLPQGAWAVTVISLTGQTWTVPNETALAASTDASFQPVTQASALLVE